MKLRYLIECEIDDTAIAEDRPPENIPRIMEDEMRSWLDDLTGPLGLRTVTITPLTPEDDHV